MHELLVAQFAAHGAEDAHATGFTVHVNDNGRVLVEASVGAVCATGLPAGVDDDCFDNVALPDGTTENGVLDSGDDGITDSRVAARRTIEHTDGQNLLDLRIVGGLQLRPLLDYLLLAPAVEPVLSGVLLPAGLVERVLSYCISDPDNSANAPQAGIMMLFARAIDVGIVHPRHATLQ